MNSETQAVLAVIEARPPAYLTAPENRSGALRDSELVAAWLATKASRHTRRAYGADVDAFIAHLDGSRRELRTATVLDVQAWLGGLGGACSSQARRIAAVKSLLTFGHRTGYLAFNVGAVITAPKVPNDLAERILGEADVKAMFEAATGQDASCTPAGPVSRKRWGSAGGTSTRRPPAPPRSRFTAKAARPGT